ncbi:tetratricopeptide repeat protein [Dictyobacter kobayashii]|uniref:Uncharacterized protein n=1 Tax=Dictyobacter kobayashii TaxID=2014872 RepID=A0A402AKM8_9CHLR|nr:tetratricopeptide repeat protein [Dictyobacter kobayashii]GCE19788.1 hypothetical protein KDK_35880 [Dictyobacter kobayashii]
MDEYTIQEREQGTASLNTKNTTPIVNKEQHEPVTIKQLRQLANQHLATRDWSKAAEAFLEILMNDPQDSEALLGLAAVMDGLNRFEHLYETAQTILDIEPNSAAGLAYKARALQKLDRISEATIANDQALLLNTNLGLSWVNRSGLQLLQGKFPEALRSAQRAIELAPIDARAWANYGVALLNFNRLAESLEAFDKSLEVDPQQLFALQMKGEILCRIGRMREVIPLVRDALALSPQDVKTLTLGIQAFRTLEMYEELKALSHQLVLVMPDNVLAWENYMRSLRGLGQFKEANEALDHLIALDGSNVRFLTMKADTLYRLERYREAVSVAERAKRLGPDYNPARRIHEKSLRLMYQRKVKKDKN